MVCEFLMHLTGGGEEEEEESAKPVAAERDLPKSLAFDEECPGLDLYCCCTACYFKSAWALLQDEEGSRKHGLDFGRSLIGNVAKHRKTTGDSQKRYLAKKLQSNSSIGDTQKRHPSCTTSLLGTQAG